MYIRGLVFALLLVFSGAGLASQFVLGPDTVETGNFVNSVLHGDSADARGAEWQVQPVACCKICRKGKACGDSCINRNYTCTKPRGCACNG